MKKFSLCSTLAILSSIAAYQQPVLAADHSEKHGKSHADRAGGGELKTAMRKLWEDHITYTRNYIISALGELGDKDAVAKRLLKNQDEIGDAIKPYYGDDAGA